MEDGFPCRGCSPSSRPRSTQQCPEPRGTRVLSRRRCNVRGWTCFLAALASPLIHGGCVTNAAHWDGDRHSPWSLGCGTCVASHPCTYSFIMSRPQPHRRDCDALASKYARQGHVRRRIGACSLRTHVDGGHESVSKAGCHSSVKETLVPRLVERGVGSDDDHGECGRRFGKERVEGDGHGSRGDAEGVCQGLRSVGGGRVSRRQAVGTTAAFAMALGLLTTTSRSASASSSSSSSPSPSSSLSPPPSPPPSSSPPYQPPSISMEETQDTVMGKIFGGSNDAPLPSVQPQIPPSLLSFEFTESVLASSSAEILSSLCCHPLDTCKARLQSQGTAFTSMAQVLQGTIREEGVQGLYRGLGTVLSIGTPAFALYLASYEVCKSVLLSIPALSQTEFVGYFVSGLVAEAVSCLLYVPVDLIKERLQVQRRLIDGSVMLGTLPIMYDGTWHALTTVVRQEGVRGIYKSYGATLLSFGPFSAFYFLIYEELKTSFGQFFAAGTDLPFYLILLSSAMAGAAASWLTNPLDLVRLRLQVQRGARAPQSIPTIPKKPAFIPPPLPPVLPTDITTPTTPLHMPLTGSVNDSSVSWSTLATTASLTPAGTRSADTATTGMSTDTPTPTADTVTHTKPAPSNSLPPLDYKNVWDGLVRIYRSEGLGGLFRGSMARISFDVPSTMISMSAYDYLKPLLHHALANGGGGGAGGG